MQTTYRAGNWYILVSPGALIALSPDAPDELVARLWEREQTEGDLAVVIDALTDHAAGSFAAMLPFAAVVLDGPNARIAVRGEVTVQVTGPDGTESFTGSNVTTWSERFVANASRIAVDVDGADESVNLPITGGVVRASHASADIEPGDVVIADAAHEVAAPVEVPVVDEPAAEIADAPESPEIPEITEEPEDEPVEEEAVAEPASGPVTEEISEVPAPGEAAPGEAAVDDAVDGATLLPAEETYSSDADEFDQLFGATVVSPGAAAPPPPAASAVPLEGDHDGATISLAEARRLRQSAPAAGPEAPTAVLPVVPAAAGRIRVTTGQVVTLDRTVIIGRRPRSTRASGAELPHLIAVESPQQDISRSHLEIRPEGDTVVVVDLHTTNGSTLLRPGNDPLRLHPGEQTLVLSGDVVDLGDGVLVTFEDLP